MKLVLVGNYPPDGQESMERFTRMLAEGFAGEGLEAAIWRPVPVFGRLAKSTTTGFGKWLGYVDKWLLFPLILRWRTWREGTAPPRFHICDHSNAPYLAHLPRSESAITCHDVLAIQGAMGDKAACCPASRTGRVLQEWILRNLLRARNLAAVSETTRQSLEELGRGRMKEDAGRNWRVILNGFNADFQPMGRAAAKGLLQSAGLDPERPFLLHVGSGLPRKNRLMLVEILKQLSDEPELMACFAGQPLRGDELSRIREYRLEGRIVEVAKPGHETLVALYSSCRAFVFPSFSEGFGWPVIEAQACGAPVIASNRPPVPEVSGGAAMLADPRDPAAFASACRKIARDAARRELVDMGLLNIRRFDTRKSIRAYLELHGIRRNGEEID